jgi:Flp pilus assembly protein TadD
LPLFRRAVEAAPQEGDSRGALATLLLDRQDFTGALRHARAYARLQPTNPYAHDLLGVALACNDQLPEAVAAFTRAVELAPAEAAIREHLRMAREMQAPRSR